MKFGSVMGDANGDDDDDGDGDGDELAGGTGDYVVALETDNTIEIISSEDGQLINVRIPRDGGRRSCDDDDDGDDDDGDDDDDDDDNDDDNDDGSGGNISNVLHAFALCS